MLNKINITNLMEKTILHLHFVVPYDHDQGQRLIYLAYFFKLSGYLVKDDDIWYLHSQYNSVWREVEIR